MNILNLYAGIGGNRKLWQDVEVTAIENNEQTAEIYQGFFPKDKVLVCDAHQYLLEHYKEYDFIWSSRPCQTHSVTNNFLNAQGIIRYPDMGLYEEIIFLKHWFKGKYCVENVISYYKPLIKPYKIDRHYFWTNFHISSFKTNRKFNIANARTTTRQDGKEYDRTLEQYHGIILPKNIPNKRLLLRNCVLPELGLHILNESKRNIQPELFNAQKNKEGSDEHT